MLVLVVVALVVVLWTPWGTRTALTFALDRYDALVPGGIGVDAVSGTLGGTLELEALELHDRNDNPLLAAEHVRLQLRLADLVGMTLGFDELALRGLVVHIGGEAQFGDLGPDGPPKPKIEGFVGPDMPLGFAGPVAIDGVTVLQHRDDGSTMALVDGALLRATLLSKGREAELRIDALSAVVAQNAIAVGAMNGVVTWADPVVRIDGLSMLSDRGILHETSVGLDAYQLYGDAVVHGLVDIAALAPDAELPIYGFVAVDVVAAGGEAHAWADVAITADPEVSLGLVLGGTVTPELDMGGTGILRLVPPGTKSPLVSLLAASIVRAPDQPMNAVLNVHCLGCDARAAVKARIDADGEATVVDARVVVADASVDAHATLRDRVLASARAQVEIPSVTNVRRELSPWIAMPEIGGSAGANATCTGGEARLDCTADVLALGLTYDQGRGRIERIGIDAKVALRDGKPSGEVDVRATGMRWGAHRVSTLHVGARGDAERLDVTLAAQAKGGRAELAAVIEPGPSTRIGLHALELDYRKLHVRLAKPSHATIGSGSATVDELRLLVDRGAIAFGGTVGPRSDANLSIERFDLRSLDALQLPVRLRGVVEARGELHGRPADPDVSLVLDANKLQVDEHVIGRIGTEIAMNGGRIETRVDWDPAPGESVDLQVRARMRPLDGPPGLVASAPLLVSLQAENLALTRLQPWLGEHTIAGKLDTTLEIRGTTRRPTITLAVDANGLAFDEMRLDDLTVDVGHDAGRVDVAVNAKAPWLDSLALTASAPVRVAGVAPYYVLDRRGRASVDMKIDGLEIAGLRGVAPALDITGRVDAEVTAKVDNAKIEGMHAELLAQNLRRAGERIATLSFAAEVGPDRAHGKLQASGPAARLVEVDVDVPLRIDLARLDAKWRRDAEHTVAVEIADADLAAIGRIAGIGGMSGHLGGTASLVGTPATPKIDVDLDGHRLAWSGHRVGELAIEVHHDGKRTRADVQQRRDEQSLRVTADVPIAINLVDGGMRWDQDGDHHLDVDAIAIDRDLLAAFVTMPEDLDFEVNAGVHARGHAESLAVNGQIRASIVADNGIDTPIGGNFDLTTKQQHVALVIGPFEDAAIEIEATAKAPLTALLQGDPVDWKAVPIVASLDTSRFPLAGIAGLLPNALAEPAGRLDVHFAADGTVGQPSLHGNAQLRGGAITVIPLRQRFDRVTLDASLDRQDIRLVKLSARSGSGTARVDGKLHLERGATKGNLDVVLAGLPIVRPGMPLMKLSTRASGVLDATGKRTEIDVVARGTTLDVFTASVTAPTALPLEDGIVYTDVVTRVGKREPTASAKEPVLPPDMSVRLKLADPIYVRGPQANMTWRGGVEIERTAGEKVRAHGALIADRGRINFLGRDFIVDSGRVTLPEQGDIDPYIALTAVTQTEEGEVTIDVHGRASRPELRLSSDPPMSESDVFALLVTGSSGADSEGEGGAVEAKAASLLAAFQNPVLQRELQDRVGIDRVGVSFGDTVDQPIVAVGKRVSRKIYLETRYHHNAPQFENNAEIHLEYSIKPPHWTIETFIGDAAKGGVEVWWRKRFGRPREPKPAKDATLSSRPPAR